MARLGKSLTILKGRAYRAALRRMGELITESIDQRRAQHLAAGTVTCVLIRPDGREWFRTDFSLELFSLIEHAASKQGITLQRFFENALWHHIRSQQVRRAA
jgi:hypothetical protein